MQGRLYHFVSGKVKGDTAWSEIGCKKDLCIWSFATQDPQVASLICSFKVSVV